MNLRQIEYALAVARVRNFSRAAQLCRVSQPSLSVAVRNLEEDLGVVLFERFKNEVKVTESGRRILEQMQRAMEEVERIRTLARDDRDPLSGRLRIGAILTIGPYLFPGLIPALHALAPRLRLLVEENFTSVLGERLKRGELDAILVALPFQEYGVMVLPLYDEPFVAAVPAGHIWQERTDLQGSELANDDLILLGRGNCFRDQVLAICPECLRMEESGTAAGNIIEGSSLETVRHMVASGAGVSVLPVSSMAMLTCATSVCPVQENRLVRYVPFAPPSPSRRVALVWRSSFPRPRLIEVLVSAILAAPPAGVTLLSSQPTLDGVLA